MKFIDKLIRNYVKNHEGLRNNIVTDWANGAEIATYNIKDSEVNLNNVCMIYSSITNCRVDTLTNSIFKDSPVHFTYDDKN